MTLWNFIRNIFGAGNFKDSTTKGICDHQNNDCIINPFWQDDENTSNIGQGNHFNVFNNPLEMTRYFESQIDDMLKSFFFGFNNEGSNAFMNAFSFGPPHEEKLRDKMLKPNNDIFDPTAPKLDTDLDGKITPDNFSNVWDKHNKSDLGEPGYSQIIGKSIMKEYVCGPDGIIKQKQIIRDHEGNEETIVSHQTGEKVYTVVIKKDKNGVETKTENFFNTEKGELIDGVELLPRNKPSFNSNFNIFSWENFFNPEPKL